MCRCEGMWDSGGMAQKEGLFGVEEEGDQHGEGKGNDGGVNKSKKSKVDAWAGVIKPDTLCPDF